MEVCRIGVSGTFDQTSHCWDSREATALSKPRARQCERSERCRRPGYTDQIYGSHNVAALNGASRRCHNPLAQISTTIICKTTIVVTIQEEFRELCRRHGLELDEQYAWD